MNNHLDRRSLLRMGLVGGSIGGLSAFFPKTALAAPRAAFNGATDRKMLVVFLRGGNDGLNAVCPTGPDAIANGVYQNTTMAMYDGYMDLRPDIHIFPSSSTVARPALQLVDANSNVHPFAELNPALAKLLPMYNNGDLAFLHRVGSEGMSRSHFADQRFWETLRPQPPGTGGTNFTATNNHRGWVAKWAGFQTPADGFHAASLSTRQQQLCDSIQQGELQAHVRRLLQNNGSPSYTFDQGDTTLANELRDPQHGLSKWVPTASHPARSNADVRVRDVLNQTLSSESQASQNISSYMPFNSPVYPASATTNPVLPTDLPVSGSATEFGRRLQDAARLLKNSTARIVCVEYGGWDNHNNQVDTSAPSHELGDHQGVLATLGQGLEAIYKDVIQDPAADDTLVLVVSEFGRTSDQNGSNGTDHANGGLVIAMGSRVNSATKQVYNFEHNPSSWQHMTAADFVSAGPRHMAHKTDFRTVFEEAFQKHLCLSQSEIDDLLPDYAADKINMNANLSVQLNYLV